MTASTTAAAIVARSGSWWAARIIPLVPAGGAGERDAEVDCSLSPRTLVERGEGGDLRSVADERETSAESKDLVVIDDRVVARRPRRAHRRGHHDGWTKAPDHPSLPIYTAA